MGVVYQAWDEELGLAVALKTIRPEVMSDPITAADVERRFKRELLLARQVTHRHVVRIHDLGEVDGVKYLTMPFIEGQTLSSVLTQSGKLPCGRALQIIREISDGLMAAHGVGVVHRDLKPENVMLDGDGRAVIMDFGISRSLTGTGAGTMMGSVVGTLEYMSPEQARGETADQRSDIYALGLMLYDMLVGRRRFAVGTSPLSEAMSRMTHAPPPVRSLEAAVPDPVERIVNRCLEPDAGKRYQTVAELIADLDRLEPDGHERPLPSKPRIVPEFAASWPKPAQFALLAAIALLALAPLAMIAIMVVNSMQQPPAAPAAARAPLSILIADFQNLANDPVFDGSLEQVLAIAMEGAPFITTFPRRDALTAARAAQGSPIDRLDVETARLVSQREGIKVVLAGSVASEGRGYRVDVRAVDAFKGEELANASRSASSKENVLQAMAAVASDVRQALGDVTPESERLAQAETFTSGKLDAAREYGIAQQLSSNGKYQESIQHYKRATEIDPDFGRAYGTWAVSEFTLGRPKEAEELYKKAFTLLNRMTKREEHRTVGTYYLSVAKDYDKAVENFSTLVREYPADRAGHSNLALSYFYTRNFAKALEHGHRATEIYGTSPKFRSNNALYAMYAGDFATAGRDASELVRDHPTYYRAYLPIAMAAIAGAKPDEARTAYETMAKVGGDQGASLGDMGLADLAMYHGSFDEAVDLHRPAITRDEKIKNKAAQAAKWSRCPKPCWLAVLRPRQSRPPDRPPTSRVIPPRTCPHSSRSDQGGTSQRCDRDRGRSFQAAAALRAGVRAVAGRGHRPCAGPDTPGDDGPVRCAEALRFLADAPHERNRLRAGRAEPRSQVRSRARATTARRSHRCFSRRCAVHSISVLGALTGSVARSRVSSCRTRRRPVTRPISVLPSPPDRIRLRRTRPGGRAIHNSPAKRRPRSSAGGAPCCATGVSSGIGAGVCICRQAGGRFAPISARPLATLKVRKLDPAGKQFGPEAYVFGNEVGEQVKSVRTAWEDACNRAGLADFHLADLRHEAASTFEEAGVPISYVSRILGHAKPQHDHEIPE